MGYIGALINGNSIICSLQRKVGPLGVA
jgi:hypothetical protein